MVSILMYVPLYYLIILQRLSDAGLLGVGKAPRRVRKKARKTAAPQQSSHPSLVGEDSETSDVNPMDEVADDGGDCGTKETRRTDSDTCAPEEGGCWKQEERWQGQGPGQDPPWMHAHPHVQVRQFYACHH